MSSKKIEKNKTIKLKNKKEAVKVLNKNSKQIKQSIKKNDKRKNEKKQNKVKITVRQKKSPQKITIPSNAIKSIKIKEKKNEEQVANKREVENNKHISKEELQSRKIFEQKNKPIIHTGKNRELKPANGKNYDNFSKKIKKTIFEEVDNETIKKEKSVKRIKFGKKSIIIGTIFIFIALLLVIVIRFNGNTSKINANYNIFEIGQSLYLNDNSKWYVIEDKGRTSATVTLLCANILDINNDGTIDDNDKLPFSNNGSAEYNTKDEGSVPHYLETTYKTYLNEKVIKIEAVELLTSKQYIKIRNIMNYGYEWTEQNILAGQQLGTWWINSYQNEKVFAVGTTGSYKLFDSTKRNYVRPVIIVNKDLLK